MYTICPKCRHARQPNENVPDWQCPACGVAYAKAAEAMTSASEPVERHRPASDSTKPTMPWGKVLTFAVVALVVGAMMQSNRSNVGTQSGSTAVSGQSSNARVASLASTVGTGDVIMYSTTECGYCTLAKRWLAQNGFAFTECNMSNDARCESEFRSYGADGTPFLVINRGGKSYLMKNGFDSDEFLALIARASGAG